MHSLFRTRLTIAAVTEGHGTASHGLRQITTVGQVPAPHTCWSFTVTGRGGLCMTGTGGLPPLRGTFLCRNFGGSIGSIGRFCERQISRQALQGGPAGAVYLGVPGRQSLRGMTLG
jgi:hypothetical protein